MNYQELVGKNYTFEDGNVIRVIQIKEREIDNELQPFVTYEIFQGRNLPRKLVMTMRQFIDNYGHLFGIGNV